MDTKIQVMSDLHLEMVRALKLTWDIPESDADVVVLAGDIDVGTAGVLWAAEQAERLGKEILYVPGNHEFYDGDVFETRDALRKEAKGTRVTLLDNGERVIGDVRFIGATLWTDFGGGHPSLLDIARHGMKDYRHIRAARWWASPRNRQRAERQWRDDRGSLEEQVGRFMPEIARDLHRQSRRYLERRLARPFAGHTVVVTHHGPWASLREAGLRDDYFNPHRWEVHGFRAGDELIRVGAYGSDLDPLLVRYCGSIDLWIHGHYHQTRDYAHHGVRFVANPRGYPWGAYGAQFRLFMDLQHRPEPEPLAPEVGSFQPTKTVSVDEGVAPVLAPLMAERMRALDAVLDAAKRYAPYAEHDDAVVAELTAYRLERLAEQFDDTCKTVIRPLLKNLVCEERDTSELLLPGRGLDSPWETLFGPLPLGVATSYWPDDEFCTGSPAAYVAERIARMEQVRALLGERVPAVLAGARYTDSDLGALLVARPAGES